MARFEAYKDQYENLWNTLTIRPSRAADAERQAQRLLDGKPTYQQVERRTGVPWWFVGLCHYRESSFNFKTYLGNGQPLSRVTTIVPKGRGPFTGPNAFADGAVDALRIQHFVGASDWGIARALYRLEGFNGYGYHGKHVNSPYLYGGSTAYGPPESTAGKYVRDHVFDPNTIDSQLGTAVVLKALLQLDSSIEIQPGEGTSTNEPEDDEIYSILWLQQALNRLGADPQLAEDGRNGPKTMGAVSAFQQRNGLTDTGLADAPTIAAIERRMAPAPAPAPAPAVAAVSETAPALTVDSLARVTDRLEKILDRVQTVSAGVRPVTTDASVPVNDLAVAFDRLLTVMQKAEQAAAAAGQPAQTTDQVRKALGLLSAVLIPGADGKAAPLGQVNGALGQTIGQLLNGKKTAIGVIGGVLTSVLSQVPAGTGLGQVLAMLTPAAGLSPYTMPLFVGMSIWGVLGKLEKWAQGTAPPPMPPR